MGRSFRSDRRRSRVLLTLAALGSVCAAAGFQLTAFAATAPTIPANVTLDAGYDSSITVTWSASAGATSYDIYRGTTSGAEGSTPYATTTSTTFKDAHLSGTPIYFYQVSAVNSAGQSARTLEDASKTPPPPITGGNVPGVISGSTRVFYCKDARLAGLDWFQRLTGWFPSMLGSSGSISPSQSVVDMAYATQGTMTFLNVSVPSRGLYTVDWRYAFQGGLFPGVTNRQMGLAVNGTVLTSTERFPITGSFDVYQHSFLQVHLNAGVNSISMLAVSSHGVSRVDQMTITPATASVPSGPTNLTVTAGHGTVTLHWAGSTSGSPTSYNIYRGTKSDGEAVTPAAVVTATTATFTDTGLTSGKTYVYNMAANNAVGVSPDSNEVSVTVP
jgi:fibronectin type III domain protein